MKNELKLKKVRTTKRFMDDFPGGIELLNARKDKYYYFNKTKSGKISEGFFWYWLEDKGYDFVFNRETKETFRIV